MPDSVRACLFDLDGVLTDTAALHAHAWKQMFDDYLRRRAGSRNEPFVPFDAAEDYEQHVDGRPRDDGVRAFLASRNIALPEGDAADGTEPETISGLGNRKNVLLLEAIRRDGAQPYEGSVRFVQAAREAGLARGVVSSSSNCSDVLAAAGIADLFEAVIDGHVAARRHLRGKPAPDTFLAGAVALGVEPARTAVFEDALAGVQAGRAGSFGVVVGVDRVGQAEALRSHGADIVVADLAELMEAG